METILLTGNPNVGKSAVFSRITGTDVISSNYPGTTVTLTKGSVKFAGRAFSVVDVPGTYCLEPSCRAEEISCAAINDGDAVLYVHVLDSTALERNLFFALELLELNKPVIFALNKYDIARRHGIAINAGLLAEKLGAPVVPFVAVTGEGITELKREIEKAVSGAQTAAREKIPDGEKWNRIGEISRAAQTIRHKHPSAWEELEELSIRPATGLPLAGLVLLLGFAGVRFCAEGLINFALDPLYAKFYLPAVTGALSFLPDGTIRTVLLGAQSSDFGLLTQAVHIALIEVFSYVLAFYCFLSLLEDTGYLARVAVLLDRVMHKVGLHGIGSIPVIMGMGCKIPGILAARVLETRRERLIALALTLLLTPCISQSALIVGALGKMGMRYVLTVFAVLAAFGLVAAAALAKMTKGNAAEIFLEIPPYRWPVWIMFFSKLRLRVKEYVAEAVPMIMAGILIISVAEATGIVAVAVKLFAWPVTHILGLPAETVPVIALGFMRKDIAVALLLPFNLSGGQLVIASVFLSMYMPCAATLLIMLREAGARDTALIVVLNLTAAVTAGALLNIFYTLL
ncbi:MAG: ferrous iron transporter B [Elusimicrobiaceae bacterium]